MAKGLALTRTLNLYTSWKRHLSLSPTIYPNFLGGNAAEREKGQDVPLVFLRPLGNL